MDRLERAARAVVDDFPFLTMRDAMKRAQASGSDRVPCFLNREHLEALEALRDALAAPEPAQAGEAVAWAGVQALIDAADKCADLMDAQECPVSSGGEEWDAALCELRERADALRAARINAWSPAPSSPGGA